MSGATAVPAEGLRERHKREKLSRILAAAEDLFARNGFAETTLRDIARIAEVATGTILVYAKTKEGLLSLVLERELTPAVQRAVATLPAADVEVQLLHMFRAVNELHARNTELSLVFVREMTFRRPPPEETPGYLQAWHSVLFQLVEDGQARGEIDKAWSSRVIGMAALRLWLMTQAAWLSGRCERQAMETDLETSLALLFRGLRPRRDQAEAL